MSSAEPTPRIGALLRLSHERVHTAVFDRLGAAGYPELRESHFRIFRFPGPHRARPTELARRVDTTKQALNPLLNELEGWGYIRRQLDPDDGRGRVIDLTGRGRALLESIRALHAEFEDELRIRLGEQRFEGLLAALREIAEPQPMSVSGTQPGLAGDA